MKVKFTIEVDAPDDATHYAGDHDDPVWYKTKQRVDALYWCWWSKQREEWMIYGDQKPHWIKEIQS